MLGPQQWSCKFEMYFVKILGKDLNFGSDRHWVPWIECHHLAFTDFAYKVTFS